jgi:5'-nucleotidase
LAAALLMTACASTGTPERARVAQAGTVTLSIVGTNDLHGGIVPAAGRGGLALLGGYLANLRAARARDGGAVLLLDGGDMFQGTLESNLAEGAPVVAAYNVLGYTAAAVGNHEFDFGPVGPSATPRNQSDDPNGALKARASEARFPFLAANLIDRATGAPVQWPNVRPSVLVEAAGVQVGILGVLTRGGLTATLSSNVTHLMLAPITDTIRTHAAALRSQGADVVIVTAHAGGRCTEFSRPEDLSSCDLNGEMFAVMRALPAGTVDAVVAGHTHAAIAHQVQGIPITEAYSNGRAFGRIDLTIDRGSKKVVGRRSFPPIDLVPGDYEGAAVRPDAAVERVLAPALEAVRSVKSRPIGVVLETPIRRVVPPSAEARAGPPVSPLGLLFSDAMLAAVPGADVSLNNSGGGLRADLPAGPLTYNGVYEVMPFDNVIVGIRLTGQQLRQVFRNYIPRGRLLGFSGVRVRADCSGATPAVELTRPSGAPVRDDESLLVVVTNFVATGGDGILTPVMPQGGFPVDPAAPLARDMFASYLGAWKGTLREEPLLERGRQMISSNCGR